MYARPGATILSNLEVSEQKLIILEFSYMVYAMKM
jgi:hypothetical protein